MILIFLSLESKNMQFPITRSVLIAEFVESDFDIPDMLEIA